ncbi:MAG: zinc ABC transporter substrate-binding protein [Chitinispirillaceae bacterium]|nr:zinc ABC transporter substrate-binding protein [Chitinispirillaceae bacterium]
MWSIAAAMLSCGKQPLDDAKPIIVVSIPPQKFFVEKIAGQLYDVQIMVPPGSSPHTFEPRPAQMVALANASIYFTIGIELEKAWVSRLKKTSPNLTIVPIDSGIEKLAMGCDHHDAHEHEEGLDPHIWLSPELVKKQCRTITNALCAADPGHSAVFRHNDSIFINEISILQDSIKKILSSRNSDLPFLVFHPAYGYFAREFGLTEIAIEVRGKEPSPREMAHIAGLARNNKISTLFVQPQFSKRSAEIIAREIGAKIVVADDLAEKWDSNLLGFAEALAKR